MEARRMLLLILFATAAYGQATRLTITTVGALPGTCYPGTPYLVTNAPSATSCGPATGTTRQLCFCNAAGNGYQVNPVGAGGVPGEVQFNNAGSLGGISQLTYDGTNLVFAATVGDQLVAQNVARAFYNASGATIFQCAAIFKSGYNIANDLPTMEVADADNPARMPAEGLLMEDCPNNTACFVVTSGFIRFADTQTAEGWLVTDQLYINTSGVSTSRDCGNTLSNARPPGPAEVQKIGSPDRINPNFGEITVSGAEQPSDVPNLTDDSAWVGSSVGQPVQELLPDTDADGQALGWDQSTNMFTTQTNVGAAVVSSEIVDGQIDALDLNTDARAGTCFQVLFPAIAATDEWEIELPGWPGTMLDFRCEAQGGTSFTVDVCDGEDLGDDICTTSILGAPLTCTTAGANDATLSATGFAAGDSVSIVVTAVSGAVDWALMTLNCRRD